MSSTDILRSKFAQDNAVLALQHLDDQLSKEAGIRDRLTRGFGEFLGAGRPGPATAADLGRKLPTSSMPTATLPRTPTLDTPQVMARGDGAIPDLTSQARYTGQAPAMPTTSAGPDLAQAQQSRARLLDPGPASPKAAPVTPQAPLSAQAQSPAMAPPTAPPATAPAQAPPAQAAAAPPAPTPKAEATPAPKPEPKAEAAPAPKPEPKAEAAPATPAETPAVTPTEAPVGAAGSTPAAASQTPGAPPKEAPAVFPEGNMPPKDLPTLDQGPVADVPMAAQRGQYALPALAGLGAGGLGTAAYDQYQQNRRPDDLLGGLAHDAGIRFG